MDEALTTGAISRAHVGVISRTARQVGVDSVAESEDLLVALARSCDPERLRIAGQRLRYCVDPDGAGRRAGV